MRRTAQALGAGAFALPQASEVIHIAARARIWSEFCSDMLVLHLHDTLGVLVATKAP
jgi:hypothetical protein